MTPIRYAARRPHPQTTPAASGVQPPRSQPSRPSLIRATACPLPPVTRIRHGKASSLLG
jgi:hypothetical protein